MAHACNGAHTTNEKCIDINCDMGKNFGAWQMGDDTAIVPLNSSANTACSFHAGNPATLRTAVKLAMDAGEAIGSRLSLSDLMGFGRRKTWLTMCCTKRVRWAPLCMPQAVGSTTSSAMARSTTWLLPKSFWHAPWSKAV